MCVRIKFSMNCQCTVGQRRWQCTWNSKVAADRFCLHFSVVTAKWADQLQLYSNCTRRRVSHSIVFIISQVSEEGASSWTKEGAQRGVERVTRGATTFTHWNMVGNSTQIRFFFLRSLLRNETKFFVFQIQKRFSLLAELSSSECWMRKRTWMRGEDGGTAYKSKCESSETKPKVDL